MYKILFTTLILFTINSSSLMAQKQILFFGDSITAGFGVEPEQAFPALLQNKIDSLGWDHTIVNGGLSGETSAGGLRRIDWVLNRKYDLMILELGGNDGLRGIDLSSTKENLQGIIEKAQAKYPEMKIIIAGIEVPPNLGQEYTAEFRGLYPGLADQNKLDLIPFILDGVGGIPELNLPDGIHPTAEGHKIIADNLWTILKPVIENL